VGVLIGTEAIDSAHGAEGQDPAEALLALLRAVEASQPDLRGHGEAVARYSVAVASRIGLQPDEIDAISVAGRLHDVGKAGIDEAVLMKPSPLTAAEWEQVRMHPLIGANLNAACGLGRVARWIVAHHERPDGRGYPYGLADAEIPLPAKILAAADAYDAMRTDRVYRPALTDAQASVELRAGAGTQFDPDVVEALLASAGRDG
jgi:HD-GYP domain-containing protein (c-di-GMP phosphodiesterase class II)